jgi:hypothetical protein
MEKFDAGLKRLVSFHSTAHTELILYDSHYVFHVVKIWIFIMCSDVSGFGGACYLCHGVDRIRYCNPEDHNLKSNVCLLVVLHMFSRGSFRLLKFISKKQIWKLYDSYYKMDSVAFSPQANYTDRATAACRRS